MEADSKTIHFISGLPRSGSTLLAALLRQNPDVQASIQTPLADVLLAALRTLSQHESANLVSDQQRCSVAGGIIDAYYRDLPGKHVVFDSHRLWCAMLPTIAALRGSARVVCCVRNPAWIMDSMERLVQRNAMWVSRMSGPELHPNVYSRTEQWSKGLLGTSLANLRQAWFGEHAHRLIVVRYESLTSKPARAMDALYDFLECKRYNHDYRSVSYDEPTFDLAVGLPGMHRVEGPVLAVPRQTILPPDLFQKHDSEFWTGIGSNPRHVRLL